MSKITLLENSYGFINESIMNYRRSKRSERYASFAILHLIQGLELMLKNVLRNEHPILIYENIDKPSNTVSLSQCLTRLKSIANIEINQKEDKAIKRAISQRNKIVHYEYEHNSFHQWSIYVELFEFIHYFHKRHIGSELHSRIDKKLWRTEAELLNQFESEWVYYKGRKLPNFLPLEIVDAQKYTTVRQKKNGLIKYFARIRYGEGGTSYFDGPCPDCGVEKNEYHAWNCDIETCPVCGEQLLSCRVSESRCNVEYWMIRKNQKLESAICV